MFLAGFFFPPKQSSLKDLPGCWYHTYRISRSKL